MSTTILALALIVSGVVMPVAGAVMPPTLDFALALARGWHVTVSPSPVLGVLCLAAGVVALALSLRWW